MDFKNHQLRISSQEFFKSVELLNAMISKKRPRLIGLIESLSESQQTITRITQMKMSFY